MVFQSGGKGRRGNGIVGDSHMVPVRGKLRLRTCMGTVRTPRWRLI